MARKRGVVLTGSGNIRFYSACEHLVISGEISQANGAQLSRYSETKALFVSQSTINQILRAEAVERNSLQRLFDVVGLSLEKSDCEYPTENDPDPDPTPQPPNNIPFTGTLSFVGREKTLDDLHALLSEPVAQVQPVALSGMGGIGKTELAIQYAQRYASTYAGGVCWIFARELDARNKAPIAAQIISFAKVHLHIDIPEQYQTVSEKVAYCWQKWPQGDVLLIYDDVDHYSDISPDYIPLYPRFNVLLTTRIQLGPPVQQISVDVLGRIDSLELLSLLVADDRTQTNDGAHHANELCEFLGDLPLGIELAGHYLADDPGLSIGEFVAELRARVSQRKVPSHFAFRGDYQENPAWTLTARRGLEAAFDLTWERLDKASQLVAKLIGRFEPGPIRWNAVEIMRELLAEEYPEDGAYDPDELTQSRSKLILFNLIKPFDKRSYRLHPLTREFFRSKTTDDEDLRYG